MKGQEFEVRISNLDTSLFDEIESQTSINDKKSLLDMQNAVRSFKDSYVYLEIGSHLGGSIQPYLLDHKCCKIFSIDKRSLVRPALLKMLGQSIDNRKEVDAVLEEDIKKKKAIKYFLRARTYWEDGIYLTKTTGPQGSGILKSMALANSLIILPEEEEFVEKGRRVKFAPLLAFARKQGGSFEEVMTMKLNVKAFGLVCGIIWAGAIFVMTIISSLTNTAPKAYDGYAGQFINGLVSIYPGYNVSLPGAVIGALWGGITNFIFGMLFAWLYNYSVGIFTSGKSRFF